MSKGWIKLHRELTDKAIWLESTPEQKTILITLLMMANHDEKEWEWRGERYKAKPGQFVTSLPSIVKKCGKGITTQNVRTALKRFEKYEFLTDQSTNRNRLITIVNWGLYQSTEDETNNQTNRQLTGNQQATNRQLTANKNDKNDKNDKKYKDNVYNLLNYWNEKGIVKHQETNTTLKAIETGLKKHSYEDITLAIDRYVMALNDTNYFYTHKWTLPKFLNQRNGVPDFLDEGQQWVNYSNKPKKGNTQIFDEDYQYSEREAPAGFFPWMESDKN